MTINKTFILAGDAIFTVEVPPGGPPANTKPYYTFRVQKSEASLKYPETYFVKLLTGPNNKRDYTYMGILNPHTGELSLTGKSAYVGTTFVVRLFERILNRIWADDFGAFEQHGYHCRNEGFCGKCGKSLTTPTSIRTGYGPECVKMIGLSSIMGNVGVHEVPHS